MEKRFEELTIAEVRTALMEKWNVNGERFRELRNECGTYVFDAVMAVLLGGTGVSKPEQSAYVVTVFNKREVSPWKANSGLKKNYAGDKYKNYQQRGFFDFPEINNERLRAEFPPEMTVDAVCMTVKNYPDECFRKNARNAASSPRRDFVETLKKIIAYAFEG